MILAQIANTLYDSVNLDRLLPYERGLLKVERFDSLTGFIDKCAARGRYVLIKNTVVLDPGDIERLSEESSMHSYDVIGFGKEIFFEDSFFSLTGNAIKECEGDWSRLKDLGYSLIKIDKENKNAKNYNVEGATSIFQKFVG